MIPQRLVVPLDGSTLAETALRIATPLADRLGATLVLVRATEDDDPDAVRSYLDGVATLIGDAKVERVVVTESKPVDAIQQAVSVHPDSIVCMTTHGRGRFRWAVAGSVAEEVIRDSSAPILLVGPRGEPTWWHPRGRVLVCIDGTSAGEAAARYACDWAAALNLEVALVFVSHPLDVEDAVHFDHLFAPLEKIVRAAGLPVRIYLIRSSFVAGVLTDLADEAETTMLVMAAHRHSEVARVALGSVVMGVLNNASCPVLVIPPGPAR